MDEEESKQHGRAKTLAKSLDRNTFLSRDKDQDVQMIWDNIRKDIAAREADPAWAEHNLEHDLRADPELCARAKQDNIFAQNLYAALCNTVWRRDDDVERKLTGETWSCSWRAAGGVVADMREEGDYIDWYMSGMNPHDDNFDWDGSVPEGKVTDDIRTVLKSLGWSQVDDPR